jgi:hypothetical protein
LEVPAEFGDPLKGNVGITVGIELPNRLFGLPHGSHIAFRIAGTEQAEEFLPPTVIQSLLRLGQQAPTVVEGVALAATVLDMQVIHHFD